MTASVPGSRSSGRERFAWGLAIFGFALLVRGLQLWQLNDSVVADMILGDAKNYDALAPQMTSCMQDAISRWKFPAAEEQTTISYTFIFKPAGI